MQRSESNNGKCSENGKLFKSFNEFKGLKKGIRGMLTPLT